MPVIGLMSGRAPNEASRPVAEAFRSGLAQIGYVEARNVVIEYYWMEGQTERFPIIATELARRTVSVIVAVGTVSASSGARLGSAFIVPNPLPPLAAPPRTPGSSSRANPSRGPKR